MPSKLSEFLMSYGGQLPDIVKKNRQIASDAETEKLRRAILEGQLSDADIERQIKRQQLQAGEIGLSEKQAEIERNKQARQKISEAFTGFGKQKELAGQATDIAEMEKNAGLKPLAEETAFQPKTMRQSAIDVGLPVFGDNEAVKQFETNYITTPEKREYELAGREANIQQKQAEMESREKMFGEKSDLQQKLLDEKLRSSERQRELDRIAAEERARIAAETKGSTMKPEEKEQMANDVIDKINIIEKHPGFKGAIGMKGPMQGFGILKEPIAGTDEAGFVAEYDALKSMLTLGNIGKLKGVLSDSDMKILRQAATSLSPSMPEKDFKRELSRIKSAMSRIGQTTDSTKKDPLGIR
jgi:hypothetical protein